MINFLPPEKKETIIYGRRNGSLINWIIASGLVLLGVGLLTGGGIIYINFTARNVSSKYSVSEQRIKSENLASYQKQAESFSANLTTTVKILKDQLLFSKIIRSIGAVLPDGVTLSKIDYDSKDSTMTLDLIGPTEEAVTQAFINIDTDSNKLFAKSDLVQVLKNDSGGYIANVVVLTSKDSEFFFLNTINSAAKEEQQ